MPSEIREKIGSNFTKHRLALKIFITAWILISLVSLSWNSFLWIRVYEEIWNLISSFKLLKSGIIALCIIGFYCIVSLGFLLLLIKLYGYQFFLHVFAYSIVYLGVFAQFYFLICGIRQTQPSKAEFYKESLIQLIQTSGTTNAVIQKWMSENHCSDYTSCTPMIDNYINQLTQPIFLINWILLSLAVFSFIGITITLYLILNKPHKKNNENQPLNPDVINFSFYLLIFSIIWFCQK